MAIGIKDRLQFQLQVNGKEVDLQQNTLDYFHLVESVRLHLPMMTLQLQDISKFFSRNDYLVDGAPIKITLGVEGKNYIFNMRLFNHREITNQGVQAYRIHAYLDAPKFWTSSLVDTITGTASYVLKKICDDTGLTYTGENTNDQQIWIPHNRKCTEFTKDVANRAYLSDQACLKMGVTTEKVMKLIDISKLKDMEVKQVFSNIPQSGESLIADWRLVNKSGFFNSVSGYQDSHISQSVIKDDVIVKATQVVKNSAKLMMNTAIKSAIGQNRVQFAPIDVGNVNENYERGKYQNIRLGNLFNTGIEFVTPSIVKAELMEAVNVQLSRPGISGITSVSGKYLVTSKVFYMSNLNFVQKVEVYRHGINDKTEKTQAS
jgi:hypothetical protein